MNIGKAIPDIVASACKKPDRSQHEEILRRELIDHRVRLAVREVELRMVTRDRDGLRRGHGRLEAALRWTEDRAAQSLTILDHTSTVLAGREDELEKLQARYRALKVELAEAHSEFGRKATISAGETAALKADLEEVLQKQRLFAAAIERARREYIALKDGLARERDRSQELLTLLAATAARGTEDRSDHPRIVRSLPWRLMAPFRVLRKMAGGADGVDRRRQAEVEELKQSKWFDEAWYLGAYPDVKREGIDPATHYLTHGSLEGRNPGPDFDTGYYMATHVDVTASGMNPLLHFIRHGMVEGRRPRPFIRSRA